MKKLEDRLQDLILKINGSGFIENRGLGNEVPYYILDYEPQYELKIREYIGHLLKSFSFEGSNISPVNIDLYDLLIEILDSKKVLGRVSDFEEKKGKDYIMSAIKSTANPSNFVGLIEEKSRGHNLVLLTGVGKVWPFMRSHNVLNNLQSSIDSVPVIMFFPGTYDGAELKLFNIFKDDNYYRGFKID